MSPRLSLVAILGIVSYFGVIVVNLAGLAIAPAVSARPAASTQTG